MHVYTCYTCILLCYIIDATTLVFSIGAFRPNCEECVCDCFEAKPRPLVNGSKLITGLLRYILNGNNIQL
jgi:hypothetical protein